MSKGAIAFAAGFGTGYLNQTRQDKLDAERKEDRDMRKQEFDAQQEERDRTKKNLAEMVAANKTATVNTDGAVVDNLSTKPVVYEDANVAASDLRQDQRLRAAATPTQSAAPGADYEDQFNTIAQPSATASGTGQGTERMPVQNDPVAGQIPMAKDNAMPLSQAVSASQSAATAPAMRKAITVNGTEYTNPSDANAAAKSWNDGRAQRISNTLYSQGRPVEAMTMEANVKAAKVSDMALANAQWQDDLGTAMRGGHEGIAAMVTKSDATALSGKTAKALSNGDGTVTYALVDAQGKAEPIPGLTFPDTANGAIQAAYMLDKGITPKDRLAHSMAVTKEAREGRLSDAHVLYYGKAGDAMVTKADATAEKVGNGVDRMSESDKQQAAAIDKRITFIQDEKTKGRISGVFDENSPAAKQINADLAQLTLARRQITSRYADNVAQSDPAGIRKPATATPTPSSGVAAGTPKSAVTITTSDAKQGQIEILNQEVATAQSRLGKPDASPEEKKRAQADLDSLGRELQRLGATPKTNPIKLQPAGGIGQAPANSTPTPAAAVKPATPVTEAVAAPVAAGVGEVLDTARLNSKQAQSRLNSFGLRQQAQDPEGFSKAKAAVLATQKIRQKAEMDYMQSVGDIRPAMLAPRL